MLNGSYLDLIDELAAVPSLHDDEWEAFELSNYLYIGHLSRAGWRGWQAGRLMLVLWGVDALTGKTKTPERN